MTALLDLNSVRAVRGLNAIGVLALVDSGHFRFVWNVSPANRRHCLRFLSEEIFAPDKCAALTFEGALEIVLGHNKQTFSPGEIERQFVVSHQTLSRLRQAGEIEQVAGRFTRASLADFLKRRLQ